MDLLEAIYSRRSVRNFKSEAVKREDMDKLLAAAVQAPSAMNSQPWAFSVIQDKDFLQGLSDRTKAYLLARLEQSPMLEKYRGLFKNPDFNIFYNAGTLLTVYGKPEGANVEGDCSLAAQNIMLTAHSLGLGSCWIGFAQIFLDLPEVKQELGVPADYMVVAPIIIGYSAEAGRLLPKKPAQVIFWQ